MGAKQNECLQRSHGRAISWAMLGVLALLYGCVLLPVRAQTFNSGSTGADGALSDTVFPASCTKSGTTITCTLPESGVYNFTTINLPQGYTLKFNRNSRNTPVTLLASGNVTIIGTIDVQGQNGNSYQASLGFGGRPPGGLGGPGGFDGGSGGSKFDPFLSGASGDGPGGGGGGNFSGTTAGGGGGGGFFSNGAPGDSTNTTLIGPGGLRYGTKTLLPLIGGSGGGGGAGSTSEYGGPGGGGGGAIVIASSGTIAFGSGGNVVAQGGFAENIASSGFSCGSSGGGAGAGGAIRLVATSISGNGTFNVLHGGTRICSVARGGDGSKGYVRIEAYNYNNWTPVFFPDNSVASFGLPSPVTLTPNTPQITITSVAGQTPANPPTGSLHSPPDVQLPASQANPIAVALSAANILVGTVITVTVTPETGGQVAVQSTPLAGTTAASTATANVNLSPGMNLINAAAIIDLSAGGNRKTALLIEGERVKRIEVSASYGGTSELTYITESGRKIKRKAE